MKIIVSFLLLLSTIALAKSFILTINRYPRDISVYCIDQKGKKTDIISNTTQLERGTYWLFYYRKGYLTDSRQPVGSKQIYLYYDQTYEIMMYPNYFLFGAIDVGYEFKEMTPQLTLTPIQWQTATYSRIGLGYQYSLEQHRVFIGGPLMINPENRFTFILPSTYLILPGYLNLNYQDRWGWSVSWPIGVQLNFLDHYALKSECLFEIPLQHELSYNLRFFISFLWRGL